MREMRAQSREALQNIAHIIAGLNPARKWLVSFKQDRETRTLAQNRRYWVAITEMAKESGHTKDEIHDAMKTMFLPQSVLKLGGEDVYIPASTPKLDVPEMSEYIERVIAFAATEFGISV